MSFLDLYIHVFHQIWKVLSFYFFQIFFSSPFFLISPTGTPITCMLEHVTLTHGSLWNYSFYSIFFCFSGSVISIQLSLAHWFCFLSSRICFWVQLVNLLFIVPYSSRIFICFSCLLAFFITLLRFPIYWLTVSIFYFNYLSVNPSDF